MANIRYTSSDNYKYNATIILIGTELSQAQMKMILFRFMPTRYIMLNMAAQSKAAMATIT